MTDFTVGDFVEPTERSSVALGTIGVVTRVDYDNIKIRLPRLAKRKSGGSIDNWESWSISNGAWRLADIDSFSLSICEYINKELVG